MRGKIVMFISLGLVGFLAVALLVYYFGAFYPKFNKLDSKKEFAIPGLGEGFVPQGIDYVENEKLFLISGYMADGSPSRLYVVEKVGGVVLKCVNLKVDGELYAGHAGGVATDGRRVWIVGDKKLLTIDYAELQSAGDGGTLNVLSVTSTGNGCDFVDVINGRLVVGEFYREGEYDTPKLHHIAVSDEETTHAVAYVYEITDAPSGIANSPAMGLTLPNQAQGIAVVGAGKDQKVVISTSWSISSSNLLVYNSPFNESSTKTILVNDVEVPLYELNSKNLQQTIKAPAMTEELTVVDGRVFIMFESACKKYRMFNRTRIRNVISIEL